MVTARAGGMKPSTTRFESPCTRPQAAMAARFEFERPLVDLGDAAQEQGFNGVRRFLERGIFRPLGQHRPEHQPKDAAILLGELDIGKASPAQGIGPSRRRFHRRAELAEAFRGHGSQEVLLADKMAVSRRRRNADPAGGLPQAHRLHPALIQNLPRRGHERSGQIAVTIRT